MSQLPGNTVPDDTVPDDTVPDDTGACDVVGGDAVQGDGTADGAPAEGAPVDASPILGNVPGSYALGVFRERHPALIQRVREALPYTPDRHGALDRLLGEVVRDVMEPLDPSAHDHAAWAEWGRDKIGRRWVDVPFLWAESYFYRKLLAATGYFEDGPWRGVDPFGPFKQAESESAAADAELAALDEVAALPPGERAAGLLLGSLWGNRADLSFAITLTGEHERVARLVVDDSALLWSLLRDRAPGKVVLVADNAGRELLADLAFADHLLAEGLAGEVVLHVKVYPYFVSDATPADVVACLRRLAAAPGEAGKAGGRLWQAMASGRLSLRAHPFSCAPLPYRDMPDDLRADFASASVTLMKGDLNYRRLIGDAVWAEGTSFAEVTRYFPGAVVALRTLKSDALAGVPEPTRIALDASGNPWRTTGTHALIQARP
ncbi:damage-control phosphatase ARMT1 family protein [Planotetraspora sp. A-T 1434]|uniref:damage-control phosphatase ARMT1 family protein n=1 Tax=Planotetraspora sp. A-T 1434 TaxID=2979219 RepID=UPI0021C08180|nr:damage-control phosphatase ARMT1 family protein [Planotetraspora sp. A-T 1434]MCT9928915.1 damage-control phosphatase ARMT1 family protein [Planotetraspora sp. A-T 1434]